MLSLCPTQPSPFTLSTELTTVFHLNFFWQSHKDRHPRTVMAAPTQPCRPHDNFMAGRPTDRGRRGQGERARGSTPTLPGPQHPFPCGSGAILTSHLFQDLPVTSTTVPTGFQHLHSQDTFKPCQLHKTTGRTLERLRARFPVSPHLRQVCATFCLCFYHV